MKRFSVPLLVFVLVFSLASLGLAANSAQIKDVDPSNPVYQSVKALVDKGYLSLYEDSTFRGDKTVTRYQLADIVAKILAKVDDGTTTVAPGDANSIRQLTVEFRKELVDIVQTQNLFTNRVAQVEKNQIVMKEDIAKSQQQILDAIDQLLVLKDLDQQLKNAQGDLASLQEQIAQVEKKMAEGLAFSVADLSKQIDDVKAQNSNDANEIKALKDTELKAQEQLQGQADQLNKQQEQLLKQQEQISKLQEQLTKMQEDNAKLQQTVVFLQTQENKQQEENKKVQETTETLKNRDYQQMFWLVTSFLWSIFAH